MIKTRKNKLIFLHFVAFLILTTLVFMLTEEIQTIKSAIYTAVFSGSPFGSNDITISPVNTTGKEWFADAPMIYHAGGQIQGNTYTNSREALEQTLSQGYNFIEIDFQYTSDGYLVCVHSWADVYPEDYQPTLEEFLSSQIQGQFTPMTAADLIDIMSQNPQMYLITDVKHKDLRVPIKELVELAEADADILSRFIIQLYTGREKSSLLEIYPFQDSQFLFTIYEWGPWSLEAAKICNEENIAVITSPMGSIPDEDVAMLRELGFTLYEHTVNRADQAVLALKRGISSFYTDNLSLSIAIS